MNRTNEDLREATAAALAYCMSPRVESEVDDAAIDLRVVEEDPPARQTKRFRVRPRFAQ